MLLSRANEDMISGRSGMSKLRKGFLSAESCVLVLSYLPHVNLRLDLAAMVSNNRLAQC